MTTECITTTESYVLHDVPPFGKKCPVCCRTAMHRVTWVSIQCQSCRKEWGPDYTKGMLARQRRELLGMSRRQLGIMLGLKTGTVRHYEYFPTPDVYFNKLEKLLKRKRWKKK